VGITEISIALPDVRSPGDRLERARQVVAAEIRLAHVPHPLAGFAQRSPGQLLHSHYWFRRNVRFLRKRQLGCLELQRHTGKPLQQRVVEILSYTSPLRQRGLELRRERGLRL